ncbi:MAG: ROK family protein, partial [Solirubrobacteraceae bacterium]
MPTATVRAGEVIGVDLGGTKVAVAALNGGELSESSIAPTELSDQRRLIEQLVSMVQARRGAQLAGVGIGVPSVVDFATGRVVSSANIPLADVPLRQVLGERLGVPVFVDNDATVAALAEAHDEHLCMTA